MWIHSAVSFNHRTVFVCLVIQTHRLFTNFVIYHVDIYPEESIQHDFEIQVDMFYSKGIYSHTNWQLYRWHISGHINHSQIWNIRLYHSTDESFVVKERWRGTRRQRLKGEKVYCVWVQLFKLCGHCGQEVELNTSTMGALLMVTGTCPDRHVVGPSLS